MPIINDEQRAALLKVSHVIRGTEKIQIGGALEFKFDIIERDINQLLEWSKTKNKNISKSEFKELLIILNDLSYFRNELFFEPAQNALNAFYKMRKKEFPRIDYFDTSLLVDDRYYLDIEDASKIIEDYIKKNPEHEAEVDRDGYKDFMIGLFDYIEIQLGAIPWFLMSEEDKKKYITKDGFDERAYYLDLKEKAEGKAEGKAEEKTEEKAEDANNQGASDNVMTDDMLEKQRTLTEINKLLDQGNYLDKQILKVNQNRVLNTNPNITQEQDLIRFNRRNTEMNKYHNELFEKISNQGELNEKQQYINRQQYSNYLFGIPSMNDRHIKYSEELFSK